MIVSPNGGPGGALAETANPLEMPIGGFRDGVGVGLRWSDC